MKNKKMHNLKGIKKAIFERRSVRGYLKKKFQKKLLEIYLI